MLTLPAPLAPLATREQFVTWFAEPKPADPGKYNKFPCDWTNGRKHDAHDPTVWTSADVALATHVNSDRGHGSGAGFVFTDGDPFFFLDIDGCLSPDGKGWSALALELLAAFNGAAVEISYSKKGLHVIGRYVGVPPEHSTTNKALGLELYTSKRFVALTGINALGTADHDCTAALHAIAARYFSPTVAQSEIGAWTSEPTAEWAGPEDDETLIAQARASAARSAAAAFGAAVGKATFEDLWTGNEAVLASTFPQHGRDFAHTEADQALANHLAFWTGKNCERIERLMRASALAREKWDQHATYLAGTILKACAYVQSVYVGKKQPDRAPPVPPASKESLVAAGAVARVGHEYMGAVEQVAHFEGCFFLADTAQIFDLNRNAVWSKSSFDVVYGGYVFMINPANDAKTDSAWDAFTKNRVVSPRIVNDLCFRPELAHGAIVTQGNRALLNSYVPYDCPTIDGDAAPFLGLMTKLFPVDSDRALILHYMASLVQNPGVKFQWWPVIQGTFGNGKTFLQEAVRFIVGDHYSHIPNAAAMARDGMKFNGWIDRKLFIGVEEIALSNKRDFLEEFKVIVTNRRIPLEKKRQDQTNADNRANGMLFTNHLDGVPVTRDERRYAIFYTPQQSAADLVRDGMGGNYFPQLYDWFYGRGEWAATADYGAAVIANYLKTMPLVAALDPARELTRAPKTTSTTAAIGNSHGRAEQEILEAIQEERMGFAGGWVSSTFLDALLDNLRVTIPRSKRRALMRDLEYDWHPDLDDGRTNDVVQPDNKKPKLYLSAGHIALNCHAPAEIARLYTQAQQLRATGQVSAPSAAIVAFGAKA